MATEIFEKSIIIAAHPDDEILWFSSVIDRVDKIVVCFLEHRSDPGLTLGRRQALSEHPFKNITALGVEDAEVYNNADWQNPVITRFGIEVSGKKASSDKYIANYQSLKDKIEKELTGVVNVFTHNPWGEYGHEEHVQIYRVVRELQDKNKFNLWYSNYCSNRSFGLALRYISGFDSEYITLKTNKMLAENIMKLYVKNGCWTWRKDWVWFNEESFKKDDFPHEKTEDYGHTFPVNMIKVPLSIPQRPWFNILNKFIFGASPAQKQ